MRGCKSKKCGQKLDTGWSFCPRCGKDNRPKEYRPDILNCGHRFEGPKRYCVTCGTSRSRAGSRRANTGFASFLVKLGVVLIVASIAAWKIHAIGGGIGYSWVSPWYDQPLKLPGIGILHGDDYPTWGASIGALALVFGVLGLVLANLSAQKPVKSRPKLSTKPNQASAPTTPTA